MDEEQINKKKIGRPRGIHRPKVDLDDNIERSILTYVARHDPCCFKFSDYIKGKEQFFGSFLSSASRDQRKLRVKVDNRLRYIKNLSQDNLKRLLLNNGFKSLYGRDILDPEAEEEDNSCE